ncbi:SecY-interacting protein [Oceanisphaera pacifica]|uniref:SecY-interacting protein n=1 Tax=Oceanisphaera pacifica TaxID=2818389 RepID=A0ABS3NJ27_9GAMM|nr:SecY-interacting protein [Oceanisphaera pacifica]MBO1520596.1 SecY-interacting protein [Oceanisphaera pacifica]
MQDQVEIALAELFARQLRMRGVPLVEHDETFSSPAELLPAQAGTVGWQAWQRPEPGDFDNVAHALEMPVHADISALFGHYYAGNIEACFKGLFLTLLQPWNEQDFERLQQNQIAHQLMMKKLKLAASWFLATCKDDQKLVTLNNATGEVQLERLGKGSIGVLAPNLATFLQQLEPC